MSDTLMVGVSGVRGLVGIDLTPEVVARWAAAFGTWAKHGKVVLGRDARTSGPMFTRAATAGLMSVGCEIIDVGLVTTPTVQLAVEHHRAAGGIILTASHNPIEWNALKFIGPDGIYLGVEDGARVGELARDGITRAGYDGLGDVAVDPDSVERHLDALLRLRALDVKAIRRRRFRVALDTVRGAGGVVMVRRHKADVGIAVDPDVDRLALVDERGRPIGEDYTLAFAVRAVLGRPDGRTGRRAARPSGRPAVVVCNLSTSLVVEDAARDCGARVVRSPVGEAHVARKIIAEKAAVGGEGNGGVMYPPLHVGRDAPVAAALVLALLARERRSVSELVASAPRYAIVKAKVPRGPRLEPVYEALRRAFAEASVDTQDGLRLAWPDRWLHVRPSNTEPIIRLIAEAPTVAHAEQLIDEARRLCAGS